MKKSVVFLALFIGLVTIGSINVQAEEYDINDFGTGLIQSDNFDTNSFLEFNSVNSNNDEQFDNDDLPSSMDLSENPYFPAIKSQGGEESCPAWSTTYYQFTYEFNKYNNSIANNDKNIYSPIFVYNYVNNGEIVGSKLQYNYNVLKNIGCLSCYDYPITTSKSWSTNEQALINGLSTKITNYKYKEYSSITGTDKFISDVKRLISEENKVVVTSSFFSHTVNKIKKSNWIKNTDNGMLTYKYNNITNTYDTFNEQVVIENLSYVDNSKNNGHAISIVGYDDNIWCDVNNNGIEDIGEKGAFKIANSHGVNFGNNGYIWILYDALKSVSTIPNNSDETPWSNADTNVKRMPIFTSYDGFNSTTDSYCGYNIIFYIENLKITNTKLIGEVSLSTNYRNQIILNYGVNDITNNLLPFNAPTDNQLRKEVVFEKSPIIFDFTDNYNSYDSLEEINSVKWKVELSDAWKDDNYITDITYCLKDNLNNVVATYNGNIEDLDGTSITKEIQLNLIRGDLNYDEEITQEDINILQSYLNDGEELSYLQKDLADINEDGDINTSDLFALLGLDTSSTQQILVDLTQLGTDIDLNFKINISSDKNFSYTLSYNDLETYEQNPNQKILNILYIENADYQIDLYDGTNYICTINNLNNFINDLGKSNSGTKYFESIGYELNYFPSDENNCANIILNTYLNGDVDTNEQLQGNDLLKLKRYLLGMYNFIQTGAEDNILINGEYGNSCNNITINGNLTANGHLKLDSYNGNVNGELNASSFSISENINHREVGNDTSSFNSLILTDEEVTELYFDATSNITNNDITDTNITIDNNIIYESNLEYGDTLNIGNYNTQSIIINSSIKSNTDIEITGNVQNSHDSIIYSSQGNIIINADNVNFNGILYAPNGSVIITGKNVSICGTIIAKKIIINSSNVNFNIQSYEDENHNTLNPIEKLLADINNDSLVNIIDLLNLKQYLLGLIEE